MGVSSVLSFLQYVKVLSFFTKKMLKFLVGDDGNAYPWKITFERVLSPFLFISFD